MKSRILLSLIPVLALALACDTPLDQPRDRCAGEYSFEQIDAWFHENLGPLASAEGVVLIDANEVTNCLDIGVLSYRTSRRSRSRRPRIRTRSATS